MWVITRLENAYDQYGDYLEYVFDHKPSKEELEQLGFQDPEHLLNGGGRKGVEETWYYLTELNSGEPYQPK